MEVQEAVEPVVAESARPAAKPDAAPAEPEGQQTFDAEYVKKLRAEAAKYRTEAKQYADKAKQWDEHSEAQKSELERANEKAQQAAAELDRLQSELMRAKVAKKAGVPDSLVERLRGATEEEMLADAEALMEGLAEKFRSNAPSRQETGAGMTGQRANYESMSPLELAKAVKDHRRGGHSSL